LQWMTCSTSLGAFKTSVYTLAEMTEKGEIRIGGKDAEFVSIRRVGRNDREDWFYTEVEVRTEGLQGKIRASFRRGELSRFAEEIEVLYQKLRGEATLEPLEPHLTLSFAGDGKGHIEVMGTAQATLGSGTKLAFSLSVDQISLPSIAKNLRATDSTEPT